MSTTLSRSFDPAMKEHAATLADFASKGSMVAPKRKVEGSTGSPSSQKEGTCAAAAHSSSTSMSDHHHVAAALADFATVASTHHHQQQQQQKRSKQQSQIAAAKELTEQKMPALQQSSSMAVDHHHHQQHSEAASSNNRDDGIAASAAMSISSIGFGVDPSLLSLTDASEAAYRAVRDAMERSAVRLPAARQHLSIHLKIGVPAKPLSNSTPMDVDISRLTSLLPRSVPLQPVQVVIGGLLIGNGEHHKDVSKPAATGQTNSGLEAFHPTICTAVACVTLQQAAISDSQQQPSPWANLEQNVFPASAPLPHQAHVQHHPATTAAVAIASSQHPRQLSTSSVSVDSRDSTSYGGHNGYSYNKQHRGSMMTSPAAAALSQQGAAKPMHHSSSMEMLAIISGEIHERHLSDGGRSGLPASAAATTNRKPSATNPSTPATSATTCYAPDKDELYSSGYNYKKLPPGVTPKNNVRRFVKHQYRDHSQAEVAPEEMFLVRSQGSSTKTPNAAFPLKLHETLTQIENDGFSHIIGWLPHGRSFKIFEQKEFVDVVLPKYFVMTKKSSFLRQLNLYGFNRLSGIGPDQGR